MRDVIGQSQLIIIPVNHMENVVIISKQYTTHFCVLLAQINHLGFGVTLEKLVNHSPSARDLQSLLVFFQHLTLFIEPINHRNV